MTHKKLSASLLRVSVFIWALALVLSSCGVIIINRPGETTETGDVTSGEDSTGEQTTAPGADKPNKRQAAQNYVDNLPEFNMRDTSILVSAFDKNILVLEDAENRLAKARYERFAMLEKKFGVSIIITAGDTETILTELKEAIASGMYYADLLVLPAGQVGRFYAQNYLLNLMSLPYVSLEEPYYSRESVRQGTIGYHVYAASGDAILNPDCIFGVFFNTGLAENLGFGNPYALVYAGQWTWDTYRAMAKAAAYDLEGQATGLGGHGAEDFGQSYASAVLASAGLHYASTEWGGAPALNEPGEMQARISDLLYDLLYADKTAFQAEKPLEVFAENGLLFYVGKLSAMYDISASAAKWGILPLPKLEESQSGYFSPVSGNMPVFAVPVNNSKLAETGLVLQALNAASYGYLTDEYITHAMNHVVRDNDTLNMLDLIARTASWDFALMFGPAYADIGQATYEALYTSVNSKYSYRSIYSSYVKAANAQIQAIAAGKTG